MKESSSNSENLSSLFQSGNYAKIIDENNERFLLNQLTEKDSLIYALSLQKLLRLFDAKQAFNLAFSSNRSNPQIFLNRILFLLDNNIEKIYELEHHLSSINTIIKSYPNLALAKAVKARLLASKYHHYIFNDGEKEKLCNIDVSENDIRFNFKTEVYESDKFNEILSYVDIETDNVINQSILLFHKSEILSIFSQENQAMDCITKAISINPNNNTLVLQKAKILTWLRKHNEAISLLNDLINTYPEYSQAYEWRAGIYRHPIYNSDLYKEDQMKVSELSFGQCQTLPDWDGPKNYSDDLIDYILPS